MSYGVGVIVQRCWVVITMVLSVKQLCSSGKLKGLFKIQFSGEPIMFLIETQRISVKTVQKTVYATFVFRFVRITHVL